MDSSVKPPEVPAHLRKWRNLLAGIKRAEAFIHGDGGDECSFLYVDGDEKYTDPLAFLRAYGYTVFIRPPATPIVSVAVRLELRAYEWEYQRWEENDPFASKGKHAYLGGQDD